MNNFPAPTIISASSGIALGVGGEIYDSALVAGALTQIDPGAGATFASCLDTFASQPDNAQQKLAALVAELPPAKWGVARQRVHRQARGRFDFAVMTPAVVATMKRSEKIAAAEQFLSEIENLAVLTLKEIRTLPTNGHQMEVLQKIHDHFKAEAERLEKLAPDFESHSPDAFWVEVLFASGRQIYISLLSRIEQMILSGEISISFPLQHVRRVLGLNGYKIQRSKKELAQALMLWLERNFPVRRWENGRLKCVNRTGLILRGHDFFHPQWPPHLRDATLKRYLKMLGWKMNVKTTFEGDVEELKVTLDFGETTFSSPEPKAWLRRKSGKFEVAALTPDDVAALSDEEKLALAKQLVPAMQELCQFNFYNIVQLSAGDREGLRRLSDTLEEEHLRLLDLFPTFSDPRRRELMKNLSFSAKQLPENILSSMKMALTSLEEGESWEEAIGDILLPDKKREHILDREEGKGYRMDIARNLLSVKLTSWLLLSAKRTEWEGDVWVVTLPKAADTSTNLFWPVDPEKNLELRAYLEVLGWTMGVEAEESGYVVKLDFGAGAI